MSVIIDKVQRTAYGNALKEIGEYDKRLVVLEADLGKSTMSAIFGEAFPERYFQMGIAEQNMASTAAGLALTGKVAFINSFAVFSTGRAYDQLRQTISIAGLNVKVCGSSAGLSDYGDGSTHQAIEDIAIMRAIPNMTVICPVDAIETAKAVKAMVETDGPMYLRVNRNPVPIITKESDPFEIGKMSVLREGTDAVVFATGIMVSMALESAENLAKEGINVRVVNVSTIKPLDREQVMALAEGTKAIVTAEEHTLIGGLGSAIADAMRISGRKIEFVGIDDCFGTSARTYEELLEYYGLTPAAISGAVKSLL